MASAFPDRPQVALSIHGGFETITSPDGFFRGGNLELGKALYKANHVLFVEERQENGCSEIIAECLPQTNINNKPYQVNLVLNSSRTISDGRCQCTAGIVAQCKHAAAVFTYVNEERTLGCTDVEQSWHAPPKTKKDLYGKGLPAEVIFKFDSWPSPDYRPTKAYQQTLAEDLVKFNLKKSSLCKSLIAATTSAETSTSSTSASVIVPDCIKTLFASELFVVGCQQESQLSSSKYEKIKVTTEEAVDIFRDTTLQALSPRWYQARSLRISASRAHQIVHARKPETALKYFSQSAPDVASLRYGREMEPLAKEAYFKYTGFELISTGLFVKPCQPWLCSTPDCIAKDKNGELICVEIKCPSSCQNAKIDVPWLSDSGLKETHSYYTQVQLQLYCANLTKAHFFVYSEADSVLVEILRNDDFL